jgi:hypothetical protein
MRTSLPLPFVCSTSHDTYLSGGRFGESVGTVGYDAALVLTRYD